MYPAPYYCGRVRIFFLVFFFFYVTRDFNPRRISDMSRHPMDTLTGHAGSHAYMYTYDIVLYIAGANRAWLMTLTPGVACRATVVLHFNWGYRELSQNLYTHDALVRMKTIIEI